MCEPLIQIKLVNKPVTMIIHLIFIIKLALTHQNHESYGMG